jgi:hypothetical protein
MKVYIFISRYRNWYTVYGLRYTECIIGVEARLLKP